MAAVTYILSFTALLVIAQGKEIPEFIHVCSRTNADMNQCLIDSVESMRELLAVGIPELNVPSLEPLEINEIIVAGASNSLFKVSATGVKAYGCSNFKINRMEADLENYDFSFGLDLPLLNIEAQYDVDGRILLIPIKGRGPMKINITDCRADVLIKGEIVNRDGDDYMDFQTLDITFVVGKGSVRLENLFGGEKTLSEAVNAAINANFGGFLAELKPSIERELSSTILKISKNVIKDFTLSQLFTP